MENPMKQARLPLLAAAMLLATCLTAAHAFAAASSGAELYKAKCAACHGPDGAAKTAMGKALKIRDLGSADSQKQSDDELRRITSKGKGKMPAFEGKLKKEQIGEVVGYIRTLRKAQ